MSQNTALPLADRQRLHTRRIHSLAGTLTAGKLILVLGSSALYGKAISCFYPIICLLESQLEKHSKHPQVSPIWAVVQQVARRDSLARDLQFHLGDTWEEQVCMTPAVKDYLKKLQEVEARDPFLLTAYFYGLYVGFCSGGQVLQRQIRRNLELPEGAGTDFFEFPGSAEAAKWQIKAAFNDMAGGLEEPRIQEWLDEGITMFKANNRVIGSFPVTSGEFVQVVKRVLTSRSCVLTMLQLMYALVAIAVAVFVVRYIAPQRA